MLVAGGSGATGTALAAAELYDPETGTWAPTSPMFKARHGARATLLPSGKVLVLGSWEGGNTAVLYKP